MGDLEDFVLDPGPAAAVTVHNADSEAVLLGNVLEQLIPKQPGAFFAS